MKKFKIGLQLYSVCEGMEKDMELTLKKVREMGYDCVEFAGYFGKSAEEVKAILDKYGLEAVSEHCDYTEFVKNKKECVEFIETLGLKYSAIPFMDKEKHAGGKLFCDAVSEISETAEMLKEHGIQMCYHNHDFEFFKYDGKFLMDWLLDTVSGLWTELDLGWVEIAGINPGECLKKYAGKSKIVHLKDFKPIGEDEKGKKLYEFTVLGDGVQNFEQILSAAEETGVEYLIVENEAPVASRIEAVKKDREYLKSLGQ